MTGKIRIGTSGWSYDSWIGRFYPEGAKSADLLALYAKSFDTVEINNTFYNLPAPGAVRKWKETTDSGFLFACKASRYLTHMKKLKETGAALDRFFKAIEPLEDRTGPILFQLPPKWKVNRGRLEIFLQALSADYRYTFEFRDRSWLADEIYELLEQYGAALCLYDFKGFQAPEVLTAGFTYVRLHGPDGAYQGSYDGRTLSAYARKFRKWAADGRDVYCYFDNDQKSYAPYNARTLLEKL